MIKIIKIFAVWCPACLIMRSRLEEIKEDYPFEQIEYDYDMDEEIVNTYNIDNILPVIIFLKDDKEVKRMIGEKSKKEIIDELKGII